MQRHRPHRDSRPPASPPGALVHVGEARVETMEVECLRYDDSHVEKITTTEVAECLKQVHGSDGKRLWLRVIGLHEAEKIGELLTPLGIHPLTQEDVLNTNHRAKIEDLGEQLYITLKSFVHSEDNERFETEQISIFLIDGLVVTFQESETPLFDPLVHRLEHGSGRLRRNGSDYLLWGLLDAVVDHYLLSLSAMEARVEEIDERLMSDPTGLDIRCIHSLKAEVLQMQRLIRPSRELVGHLERGESPLVSENNRIYFRDLYDHALRCTEDIDVLRESINGLRDYYLSAVSNRMNEVMKILTCLSTIFLPLTFLAGIYGMNFEWMPELAWKPGYPTLWAVFILAAGIMFYLFRKNKWL
ncbi:MAG: magnesium transporter [Verrucomicrobiales bacterium]|jgi:magnesium transporter